MGLSPIVGGRPVRGMADACLPAIGVETTAEAVGRPDGARNHGRGAEGGLLDGWLVRPADRALPNSTSCSKLFCTDAPPFAAAPLTERASVKNSAM